MKMTLDKRKYSCRLKSLSSAKKDRGFPEWQARAYRKVIVPDNLRWIDYRMGEKVGTRNHFNVLDVRKLEESFAAINGKKNEEEKDLREEENEESVLDTLHFKCLWHIQIETSSREMDVQSGFQKKFQGWIYKFGRLNKANGIDEITQG